MGVHGPLDLLLGISLAFRLCVRERERERHRESEMDREIAGMGGERAGERVCGKSRSVERKTEIGRRR